MAEPTEARMEEMEKSINALETQIRDQLTRTRRGTRIMLIVGAIIIIVLIAYLSSLVRRIKEAAQPEGLAEILVGYAQTNAPKLIEDLGKYLKESAPGNVKAAREMLMDRVVSLRTMAEKTALEQLDAWAKKLDEKLDSLLDELIKSKKDVLEPLIEAALAKGPAEQEALAKEMKKSLDELIGTKMDEVLKEMDTSIMPYEMQIDRLLKPDSELNPREKRQKEMVVEMLLFINNGLALSRTE